MATTTRILDANVNGIVYTANANDALEALDTCHSGTTAPTDEVANGKFWLDTSTTPSVLKVYDNAGWNVVYSGRGDLTVAGTVNATALTGNGSGITGVATAAQGTLADSAVQPNDSPTFGVVTATSYAGDGSALTGIPLPPSQTTAVWEAGTDTTESTVSAAKVASAIAALAQPSRIELARADVTSSVSSVQFTTFDHSVYGHYEFVFRDLVSSSTAGKKWEITVNNISTSAAYDNSHYGSLGTAADSAAASSAFNQYSFTENYNGDLKLFAAGDASSPTMGFGTQIAAFTSGARMATWGFSRNANEVATSIEFQFSAGNITAGDIVMYGVK